MESRLSSSDSSVKKNFPAFELRCEFWSEFIWSRVCISNWSRTCITTSSAKLTNEQSLHLELINGFTGVSACGCTRPEYLRQSAVWTKIYLNEEEKCQLGSGTGARKYTLRGEINSKYLIWCRLEEKFCHIARMERSFARYDWVSGRMEHIKHAEEL